MDLANKKILILAPHPDDELISSFYIIKNAQKYKAKIKIVFITSGERNYIGNIKVYKSLKLNAQHYASIREDEARLVMKELGINDFEFWRFPDLGVSGKKQELFNKLIDTIKEFKPDILISPSVFDLHKDHNSVGIVVYSLLDRFKDLKIFYYIVHNNSLLDFLHPNVKFKLSDELKEKKKLLFNYYKSQFLYNKSFFLNHLDENLFSSHNIFDNSELPLEIDFTGKDFVWLKFKHKNSFFYPLRLNISVITQNEIYDFNVTLNWNKRVIPLYLNKEKTLCSYIRVQRIIGEGGYIIIPLFCFKEAKHLFIKLSNLNPVFDITGYTNIKMMNNITRNKSPKVCVVIPCFNIAELCSKTVERTLTYADNVIVVNDGSTDNTKEALEKFVKQYSNKLHLLNLPKNMGKGNALIKGILYALQHIEFDLLITMDGDMQHRPEDIPLFKEAWQNGADMILGVRSWNERVPLRSRIGNFFINKLCGFLLKNKITDSQTGFRGFSVPLLQKIIDSDCIKAGRYETELDILLYSYLSGARISEVEIPTIYLEGNASSHFNPVLDSLRIIKEAFAFYIRFYKAQKEELEDKVIIDNS